MRESGSQTPLRWLAVVGSIGEGGRVFLEAGAGRGGKRKRRVELLAWDTTDAAAHQVDQLGLLRQLRDKRRSDDEDTKEGDEHEQRQRGDGSLIEAHLISDPSPLGVCSLSSRLIRSRSSQHRHQDGSDQATWMLDIGVSSQTIINLTLFFAPREARRADLWRPRGVLSLWHATCI